MKKNYSATYVAQAAVIAAIYVVLTYIASMMGIANGVIQVRFSEMMCILPIFTGAAVPGLFVGCIISNIIGGCVIWDIIFGSIATLLGAIGTRMLRNVLIKGVPVFSFLPPIVSNMLIIPFILSYAYGVPDSIIFMMGTVGLGELISVGVFGSLLFIVVRRYKNILFPENNYSKKQK